MKKILTCVITILCAMTIQAKDEIVITNGDFTCLKEKGKRAIVHIDWSNAEIVKFANDEKSIEEQLGSFDNFMAQQDDDALVNMVIKPRLQKKHYGRKEWMNIQIKQAQAKMKDASIVEMLMKALPEMTAAAAAPLANVDKIIQYGDGNSTKLIKDVTGITSQVFESLNNCGIDLKSILAGMLGGKVVSAKIEE